jgi:hypothetical protein
MASGNGDLIARLYAEFGADNTKLKKVLAESKTDLGKMKSSLSDTVRELTGFDAASIGAAAAVGVLAKGIQISVSEAIKSEKAHAQLVAVLKSTKGAAGMTEESVLALSSKLSDLAGVDDDVVTSASNMMLTFTTISKEIFPEVMQTVLDMSTALGTDLKGSVIQVGKALNNPIIGMSALQEVGVAFTNDQKKLIRTLQESGDIMGAQKVILNELSVEFGGSAAAAAQTYEGKLKAMNVALAEGAEAIGNNFLPALTHIVNDIKDVITWHARMDAVIADHVATVTNTSNSYKEYAAEIERTRKIGLTQLSLQEKIDYYFFTTEKRVKKYEEAIRIMSEAEWENVNSKSADVGATIAQMDAYGNIIPVIDTTTKSTSGLGKAMQEASQSGGKAMLDMKKMADDMQAGIVDATQGIMDAQKNWAEQTGGDVVNALEKAGLKGQDLRTAIGFVDDEYQSSYGTQFDYKEAVGDLATKYAEGKLSGDDFKQGLKDIKAEYMPLNDEIRTANELLWQLQLKWQWLQKNRNLDMSININQNGGLPNIGGGTYSSGGKAVFGSESSDKVIYETGGESGGPSVNVKPKKKGEAIGYATGGSYVIPAGYYENYPVGPGRYASSGETVKITPKGKTSTEQTVNLSVNIYGGMTDRATAEKYARYTANYLKQRL